MTRRYGNVLLAAVFVVVLLAVAVPPANADDTPVLFRPPGTELRPRLIRSMEAVYVIDRGKRRWIVSPQVFTDYRFREEWIEQIPDDDLNRIGLGPDLVAGPVLRGADGRMWIVYQGTRREVVGTDAYAPLYLQPNGVVQADESLLATYPVGRPAGNRETVWPLVAAIALACGGVLASVRRTTSEPIASPARRLISRWGDILALTVLSAILKFWYVALWPWIPDGADAPAYVGAARFLVAGNSVFTEDKYGTLVTVTSSAYPIILALTSPVTWITSGNVLGWKLLQVVAAASITLPVGAIAYQIGGTRPARVAATIAALSPAWFYSADLLQYELWLGLAIATATHVTVRRASLWQGVSTSMPEIVGGIAWAFAAFTQVKTVVLLGPIAVWTWWWTGGRDRRVLAGLPSAAIVVALALAPIIFWGVRNVVANGAFVIGSTGSGTLLWIGNQPSASGGYMSPSRPPQFYDTYQNLGGPEVTRSARAFAAIAWDEIATHPDRVAVIILQKLERFWWTITPDRLGEHLELRTVAFLGWKVSDDAIQFTSKLMTVTGLGLAITGIFSSIGRQDTVSNGARWLVVAVILAFWIAHIPFIAEPRYRLPILPLLQVLEGIGLVTVIKALHKQ